MFHVMCKACICSYAGMGSLYLSGPLGFNLSYTCGIKVCVKHTYLLCLIGIKDKYLITLVHCIHKRVTFA